MINSWLKDVEERQIILVGHSFGGPIVAKSAVLNPAISSIVMLAPVNDPYNEKLFWVSYVGKWGITRWMMSKAIRVATDEKFSHAEELKKIENDWSELSVPVVHIHGEKDWIAPIENVDWSSKNINTKYLKLIVGEKLDHFIPFTNQDLVVDELLKLISK